MGGTHGKALCCPGGSGVRDGDGVDLRKRKMTATDVHHLSLYEDVAASTRENDFLAKSTEHGFLGAGKAKKRPRGVSLDAILVPEAFQAENLRVRRPRANTSSSRGSRGLSNVTNTYHYSNNSSSYEAMPSILSS
ncbi:hypothetical protein THRCLA_21809 [Thraustotheca clavata]|uniref:Uncharacterized protein n=1 Tax=Thraustotheca clavata TaxID=74557 RepID=A0A1V9ZNP6_9STRA|nr:hypothetical protein THRCLA_21809 [Thraustotheca clavata]